MEEGPYLKSSTPYNWSTDDCPGRFTYSSCSTIQVDVKYNVIIINIGL